MIAKPQNVQELDEGKLDVKETDGTVESSRIDENTRTFKFKGFGLNLQFEWKKKSWMRL